MTKHVLSLLSLCIFLSAQAQFSNVVPVKGDYLYFAITEVSNIQYKEFQSALKKAGKIEEYKKNLPDTLGWSNPRSYNDPYIDYYHQHPAYNDYPVVNVNYEQAMAFCKWLEDSLNTQLKAKKSNIKKVVVRLPTEQEWEFAARGGGDTNTVFPWGTDKLMATDKAMKKVRKSKANAYRAVYIEPKPNKNHSQHLANYNRGNGWYMGVAGSLNDNADITAPVQSYWPNPYGLYNMSGNVAEMVMGKGKNKGGSWQSPGYYLQINAESFYDDTVKSCPGMGFRYIIEVLELDTDIRKKKDILVDAKYLEKNSGKVKNNLFASKHEVSNRLYNIFLEDMRTKDNYTQYQIDNTGWDKYTEYPYFRMYGSYLSYDNYPVVNISHEAAIKFCEWLTEKYNSDPKKGYKKVVFRLPTEAEWELAARGGLDLSPYPWGGPYIRNNRGNYLCNFNPREERFRKKTSSSDFRYLYPNDDPSISRDLDGADKTCEVNAYSPNSFGLYNMSGNAAEMVEEKGISRGGSWVSTEEDIITSSKSTYTRPDATLGFRFFMEIIEE